MVSDRRQAQLTLLHSDVSMPRACKFRLPSLSHRPLYEIGQLRLPSAPALPLRCLSTQLPPTQRRLTRHRAVAQVEVLPLRLLDGLLHKRPRARHNHRPDLSFVMCWRDGE